MTSELAILRILNEQVTTYADLQRLLRRERTCLVEADADRVEEISKEKDTIVIRLRLLEEERLRLVRKLADERDLDYNVNLEQLGNVTGNGDFHELRSKLLSLLQSIEELNRYNGLLIDRSIRHIKRTANFFSSFSPEHLPPTTGTLLSKET